MGVALKDLLIRKPVKISDLQEKVLAVDTYNLMYQFLTTIRQRDGSLLTDSKGNVTSVLIGICSRIPKLMSQGLKLVFIMDGIPPNLKSAEIQHRSELKKIALKKFKEAEEQEDKESMKKFASMTSRLTPEIIESAKNLLTALGLPIVQAPSEGEAQGAFLVKKNVAYAMVSQDFDSLLYGSSKVVRNLSISGKRKFGAIFKKVEPEIINLDENLNNLGITLNQLIILGILVGTDYNRGGIKGIGPKKALKIVKDLKSPEKIFNNVEWPYTYSWKEVYRLFTEKAVQKLLLEHEFSEERIDQTLAQILPNITKDQKGLSEFF
jgi:flap endonuclease-1